MNTIIKTVPTGNSTVYSLAYRHLFADGSTARAAIQANAILDAAKSRDAANSSDVTQLRAGVILGKITSGGKYRPSIIGLTTGAATSADTSLTVAAATATEIQRLITAAGASISLKIVGPPSAAGTVATKTVTASAASGTTVTLSNSGGISANSVSGSLIMPADGAETPLTFAPDGYGIPLVDATGASQDQLVSPFFIRGHVDVNQIVNYPSDSSLKTWLKAQLRTAGDFTFSDDF